jgi:cytochrome c oxidase assembly protein subunit 15
VKTLEATTVPSPPAPRWLHGWAVLTVVATAVLLALGAVVTTFRVGMADPVWPTAPWYLFFISWREPSAGFLIEHSHRLAGYVVGCCAIVLAAGLFVSARCRGLPWLGLAALLGVTAQGLLGGFRVKLNALAGTDLAAVHGCFAQVVFSLLVSLALLTSGRVPAAALGPAEGGRLRRLALLVTALAFLQLVWGALVRHTSGPLAQRAHLLTAFAVVAAAAWLARAALASGAGRRVLGPALAVLGALLAAQLFLGVEAWMNKFAGVALPELQPVTASQAVIRTGHVLVGSWVLASAVVLALLAHRAARAAVPDEAPAPSTDSGAVFRPATAVLTNPARQLEGTV